MSAPEDFAPAFVSFGVAAIGHMEDPPPVEISHVWRRRPQGSATCISRSAWTRCQVYSGEALERNTIGSSHHRIRKTRLHRILPPKTRAHVNAMGALVIDIEY